MLGWLVGLAAWGGIPEDVRLRPVAATSEVRARFARWQVAQGLTPSPLHCQPLAIPEVQLCFRVWEGSRRRWLTEADRVRWRTSPDVLRTRIEEDCVASLARAEFRTVEGSSSRYLILADGDGRAVAGITCPLVLSRRLGAKTFRAALPTEHILLAWPAGDAELDRIMAVGVREIQETESDPLTPQVLHFDGERWHGYGRAVPR